MTYSYTEGLIPLSQVLSVDALNTVYSFWEPASLAQTDTTVVNGYKSIYTIDITGTLDAATETVTLTVEIKNPCVDSDYNNVLVPVDYSVTYSVMKDPMDIVYSDSFFVTLAEICGGIDFTVTSGTSTEITDDPLKNTLSVYATDLTLMGTS